jgi:hypothetical protein
MTIRTAALSLLNGGFSVRGSTILHAGKPAARIEQTAGPTLVEWHSDVARAIVMEAASRVDPVIMGGKPLEIDADLLLEEVLFVAKLRKAAERNTLIRLPGDGAYSYHVVLHPLTPAVRAAILGKHPTVQFVNDEIV